MMLGRNYRFAVTNSTGVTVGATVQARRFKFATDGSLSFEATETEVFNDASILTTATDVGSAIDNSTDKYMGGDFELVVTPSASASGTVALYIQHSTDGGTTWDSAPHAWVAALTFAASASAQTKVVRVD